MKVSEVFTSRFVGAPDLHGRPVRATIADCVLEDLEDESKPCLLFVGAGKGLLLNRTNALVLVEAFGDETDAWRGRVVEIYPTKVPFRGKLVDAVRLRIPADASPAPAPAIPDPALAASAAFQAPSPSDTTGRPPF